MCFFSWVVELRVTFIFLSCLCVFTIFFTFTFIICNDYVYFGIRIFALKIKNTGLKHCFDVAYFNKIAIRIKRVELLLKT